MQRRQGGGGTHGRGRTGRRGADGHRRTGRGGEAQRADPYELYERSVQEPEADIALVQRIYRGHYGRPARTLREDFCGTAVFACEWVRRSPDARAFAIDLDPRPLAWGRERHVAALAADQAARLKLVEGDVRDVGHEQVDVTVAFNFSYNLFRTRSELRHYFERARATLGSEGLFVLDAYGGADAQRPQRERRRVGSGRTAFTYVWDQHSFDPITHHVVNFIHFEFPDGSRLRRAFRYDWRLWMLPEVRELLHEAGFRRSEVYWEGTDHATGEGNGIFRRRERAEADPAWIAYVSALP
jgi:hypothetical protein